MSETGNTENVLLGAILSKEELLDNVFFENKITADFFSDSKNSTLYAVFTAMHLNGIKIDSQSVFEYCLKTNMVDKIGGMSRLLELEQFFNVSDINFFISELKGRFIKSKTMQIIKNFVSDACGKQTFETKDIEALKNQLDVFSELSDKTQYFNAGELFNSLKERTDFLMKNKNQGYLSGFNVFDKATNGFQGGELYILGARPSIGKTSLALTMCHNLAKTTPTAFISLETPYLTISQKLGAFESQVPLYHLRNGYLNESSYKKVFEESRDAYMAQRLVVVDKVSLNVHELKGIVRRLAKTYGAKVVFLDYIGLVDVPQNLPVYEKQSIVSKTCKQLARELDIALVALCQVARETESKDIAPTLANLRGSGSIEQDADCVVFLHGQRYSSQDEPIVTRNLIIAKNRNGECLQSKIDFIKNIAMYRNHEEGAEQ